MDNITQIMINLINTQKILYLYYDKRTDIQWNIAWVRGKPRGISQGLRLYFTVYLDSSHNTDILNFLKYTSSLVHPGRAILEELMLRIGLAAGLYFPYCSVDEAIRVRIDPVENSVVAALGNIHGQESNTRRVTFQYHPFY